MARIIEEYLKRGKLVAVEGKLQVTSRKGKKRKVQSTEIIVDNLQMLDSKFYGGQQ